MRQDQAEAGSLSAELVARRLAAGLSFEQIIRRGEQQQPPVHLSKSTLSDWFSGRSVPRAGRAFAFVTVLLDRRVPEGVPVRWEALRAAAQAGKSPEQRRVGHVRGRLPAVGASKAGARLRLGRVPGSHGAFIERAQGAALAGALVAPSGSTAVAGRIITGTGGAGKSQLAARYCHTEGGDADLLMWVTANSTPAVTGAYAQAARVLELPGAGEESSFAAEQFLNWLSDTPCDWLLVLDDVLSPGALEGWWPPQQTKGRGRVIVTTRSRESDLIALSGLAFLPIGTFEPHESLAHLRRSLNRQEAGTDEELAGLAEDLGHLPLALTRAAAFLDFSTASTVADYRRLLADRRLTLQRLTPPARGRSSTTSLAALWDISIEQADLHTRGAARPMMELAAYLDGTAGIPDSLFVTEPARTYLTGRAGMETPVDAFGAEHTLATLDRLNLLDHNAGLVHVHQLIQRTVREYEPAVALDSAVAEREGVVVPAAADALLSVWPDVETDQDHAQRLRACAQTLIDHDRRAPNSPLWLGSSAHGVLYRLGISTGESGDVLAASDYFEMLSNLARQRLGPDHPHAIAMCAALARWHSACGCHADGISILEDVLSRQSALYGADDPATLVTRHNLAVVSGEAGDPVRAVAMLEEILAIRLRDDAEPTAILATRHNLAYWMMLAGHPEVSLAVYRDLVPEMEQEYGVDEEGTLTTRHNLARAQGETGDSLGAIAGLEALLLDQIRALGPAHPRALFTRQSLGRFQAQAGQTAQAIDTYRALIPDMERISPHHPELLSARHNLAVNLGTAGLPDEALSIMLVVVADRTRVLGPHHPDTFSSRRVLADLRSQIQGPASALKDFEDLQHDVQLHLPPTHPGQSSVRLWAAQAREAAGDVTGAIAALQQLLTDVLEDFGPSHRVVGGCLEILGSWQRKRGDAVVAALMYRDLAHRVSIADRDHPWIVHLLDKVAEWQGRTDPARAMKILARARSEAVRLQGPNNPNIPMIDQNIAFWSDRLRDHPPSGPESALSWRRSGHSRVGAQGHH
jgi:hypothetical protein